MDPWGIRTAFYYYDDEVAVVASERPVIQTAFNLKKDDVHELLPGEALVVKRNGKISLIRFLDKKEKITISFFRTNLLPESISSAYKQKSIRLIQNGQCNLLAN